MRLKGCLQAESRLRKKADARSVMRLRRVDGEGVEQPDRAGIASSERNIAIGAAVETFAGEVS